MNARTHFLRTIVQGFRVLADSWQAVLSLIWPQFCVGCAQEGSILCTTCHEVLPWAVSLFDSAHLTYPLPIQLWVMGSYQGPWRRVILAWKRGGLPKLTTYMRCGVQESVRGAVGKFLEQSQSAGAPNTAPIWVVPAPSGWQRRFSRRLVAREIADVIAQEISYERPAIMADVLRQRGKVDHGLGQGARMTARHGSMHCVMPMAGREILIVDDVVTTGATLTECMRALQVSGGRIVGGLALAATPKS